MNRPIRCAALLIVLLSLGLNTAAQNVDTALNSLKAYKAEDDRAHLAVVEAAVASAKDDKARATLADKLMAFACDAGASIDARRAILFQLRSLASAAQVPALVGLLKDPNLAVEARGVLETVPAAGASQALRESAKSLSGAELAGVLASLGVCKDEGSVSLLESHLQSTDPAVASAAAWSLGQIGTPAAGKALLEKGNLKSRETAQALLQSARTGHDQVALAALAKPPVADDIRITATAHLLVLGGKPQTILAAATSTDPVQQSAAIEALRLANKPAWTAKIVTEATLGDPNKILGLLLSQPDREAAPAFIKFLSANDPVTRKLAIRGLAVTGDESAVVPLLAAAQTDANLLSTALAGLKGDKVDGTLKEQLTTAQPPVLAIVIRALVERNVTSAVPALARFVNHKDAATQAEAIRSLGELGDPAISGTLIALLANDKTETAGRNALVSLCRRHGRDVAPIAAAYESADPATKRALLKVISAVGGQAALALVRRELRSTDPATRTESVRCLTNWADDSALADLAEVAASSTVAVETTLALRAIARLVPLAASLDSDKKLQTLITSLKLANDAQTRTALISAVGNIPTAGALELLITYLADKEQCAPAAAAILTIAKKPGNLSSGLVSNALNAIVKANPTPQSVQQAKQELKKLDKPTPPAAPPTALKWSEDTNSLALLAGDKIVWRFVHDPADGKPHFDPLAPVGKPSISWKSPSDHVWHYGLWFSWKLINGVNYWEEDKNTRKAAGLTSWKDVQKKTNPEGSATISMTLEYSVPNQPPVLTEKRTIAISAPAADGSYTMDWTLAFTVGEKDIVLDRTPLPGEPNGKSFGGYAGLSMRMKKMPQIRAITPDGPCEFNKEDRFRGPSLACDYSGKVDGEETGVAMIDHPSNLNAPSPWYVIRGGMNYFNAAVLLKGPVTKKSGETFTLKYRVIVHPGAMSVEQLQQAVEAFAK